MQLSASQGRATIDRSRAGRARGTSRARLARSTHDGISGTASEARGAAGPGGCDAAC